MPSSHHPQPWSLRPEELLIASARDRLLAGVAMADTATPDAPGDDPRPGLLASRSVRAWLGAWSSPLHRAMRATQEPTAQGVQG